MSKYSEIQFQIEQCQKAFNQNPNPSLAGAMKRLIAARRNSFSPARLQFLPKDVKVCPMAHHEAGLSYTASGYGEKIPTIYKVNLGNTWRRVYCRIFSNVGICYICCHDGKYIVDFDQI